MKTAKAARRGNTVQISPPVHPFDRRFGTETSGLIPGIDLLTGHAHDRFLTAYYGTAPSILEQLLERWSLLLLPGELQRWTFVDFGSGKGRAVMIAAQQPFRQVLGIELNAGLVEVARSNWQMFQAHGTALAPVVFSQEDALSATLPLTPIVAFFFHPFEAPLFRGVIHRLEEHSRKTGYPLDLLYVNAEFHAFLQGSPQWRTLFYGPVAMSAEDHLADLAEIANMPEYGSTGDETCGVYRYDPNAAVEDPSPE